MSGPQFASGMKLLANKTALLTGASRGIGSELARRLTEEGVSKLLLVAHPHHKDDLKKASDGQACSRAKHLPCISVWVFEAHLNRRRWCASMRQVAFARYTSASEGLLEFGDTKQAFCAMSSTSAGVQGCVRL